MTLDTEALIRDVKSAFTNRTNNSSSGRPSKSQFIGAKSTTDALAYRERGNRLHKEMKFQEALISYTKSVAAALEDSEELCKAYGNRSAALFQLEEYELCLLDINRALKAGRCPDLVLREKLLDRKKRCLARTKSSIDEDGTNPVERESTRRANMLSKFGNPLLPNASPKIKLKYDEKWGRHFVATADIDPGETLISVEYFIAVAFQGETRFKFCDFCTTMCHAMIPCPSCASTLYCSEQCRTMAYSQYHRIECKLSASPITSNFSLNDPIPIRLFLVGTKQGAALENLMNNLSISDIFEEKYDFADKPFTGDYIAALRMIVESFEPTSMKSRIKDAVEVVTELRKLTFFENVSKDRLGDAEVFAAALLLNNYKRRHTNLIFMDDLKSTEIGGRGVGEGLALLQYMMNHSCYPNVCNFRRKRDNIMYSVRPIKKNEQLFCSYCPNFECYPKWKRSQGLDFVCQCEACVYDWPSCLSESSILRQSLLDQVFEIEEDLLPNYQKEYEFLFAELMNITPPLLDDTALLNLEVREIVSITVRMVSLLYKMMKPMSFSLAMFRHFLVRFTEIFYDERERDPSLNKKLSFPHLEDAKKLNKLFTQQFVPKDPDPNMTVMMTIFYVTSRLNFYSRNGHFVNKNIIG